jgi:transposase
LISKYGDSLPLYRQAQIFARHGVTLDRSTLCERVFNPVGFITTPK